MKRFSEPILVTRPYLPNLEDFKKGCEEIWSNQWLTNNGPVLKRFEKRMAEYLGVPVENIALFNNGTLALELGYYAMGLAGGDVITTPFTFVATSHALKRIGATPIFADIDPETLCLSPEAVEKLITPRTKAIVPVHVYGNVCDIEGFERLSQKYGIPVIYDAAHAFGVTCGQVVGESCSCRKDEKASDSTLPLQLPPTTTIGACGDMSMFSLHPTKLFHSCEGGVLVFKDPAVKERLAQLRNFAIKSETECVDVGSNAKMNELQALMGCLCLNKIDELLAWRDKIDAAYSAAFTDCDSVEYVGKSLNHAYCPILFKDFETRERVYAELKEKCNVYSRRYFYPLLTDFAPYVYSRGTCTIAENIAKRVLTLPTYYGLASEDVVEIANCVKEIVV